MKKTVTLNPGEGKVITFTYTPTVARSYQVIIDGLSGNFAALPGGEAEFAYVSNLLVVVTNVPSIYDIAYTVSIRNTGVSPAELHLEIYQSMCEPPHGAWTCADPPNWSGWNLMDAQSAILGPGETRVFTGSVERAPYIYRLKAVSEAGEIENYPPGY